MLATACLLKGHVAELLNVASSLAMDDYIGIFDYDSTLDYDCIQVSWQLIEAL